MFVAAIVVYGGMAYCLLGLVVGVPFVLRGVDRLDPAARGAPLGFRLLILPGSVALWPWLMRKWIQARRTGGTT